MTGSFVPPYPAPHRSKASLAKRFLTGWNSWIHTLFERSYTMKMGEVHFPRLDFYIANDPAVVARVMDDNRDADDGNPPFFPKHRMLQDMLDPLIGPSLFAVSGQQWDDQRRMVHPAFAHTRLQLVFDRMREAVDDVIAALAAEAGERPVDVDPHMTHVAADIIYRTIFSVPLDRAGSQRVHEAFHRYQKNVQPSAILKLYGLPQLGFRRRAKAAAAEVRAVFAPLVVARHDAYRERGDAGPPDIFNALLRARHPRSGEPFTAVELIDQIALIFMAGHETSASAMSWGSYLLAECPAIQEAVRAEVVAVAGDGPIGYDALRAMPVTRNVFRETLRLYPPISFFMREVVAPTVMRGKRIKPGSMIVVSPWLIQRNGDDWRCPHAFDPDRFERPEEQDAVRNAYLPFGRGPRVCLGAGFAQQEAMLVLASLVRRFGLTSPADDKPEPVSRLTLRPKHGLRLRLRLDPVARGL